MRHCKSYNGSFLTCDDATWHGSQPFPENKLGGGGRSKKLKYHKTWEKYKRVEISEKPLCRNLTRSA